MWGCIKGLLFDQNIVLVVSGEGVSFLKQDKKQPTVFFIIEPVHAISNNVVCATSKASDHPVHTRSLIRAFASRLNILYDC